jgi:hypothetical protein
LDRYHLTTFLIIMGAAIVPLAVCALICRTLLRKSNRSFLRTPQGFEMDSGIHKAQMGVDPVGEVPFKSTATAGRKVWMIRPPQN